VAYAPAERAEKFSLSPLSPSLLCDMNAQVQHETHRTHTHSFFLPVNGSLPADELVAVGAGVLHALVHALHVHLQLVVQRESSTAHIQRISLTCERKSSC
jgi:hypothetical protein